MIDKNHFYGEAIRAARAQSDKVRKEFNGDDSELLFLARETYIQTVMCATMWAEDAVEEVTDFRKHLERCEDRFYWLDRCTGMHIKPKGKILS